MKMCLSCTKEFIFNPMFPGVFLIFNLERGNIPPIILIRIAL